MKGYIPTIGLEIHAELKTKTKMFCDSKNDPDEKEPNVNVCPVCMGYPGTLPTINKEAVKHIIKIGRALSGTIADRTEFERKNYFYPDIPKGYQISQYKYPIVSGGSLSGIAITRVHLEEDTARSTHDQHETETFIDFNRAGIPLMELVTEPVMHSAKEAGNFARELQLLLRCLGASEANMEKGEMRVEANVSVAREGGRGTKVEVKNLNSFRVVERAIEYEIKRQIGAIEKGEKIIQETRGWDEKKQSTFSQRQKEESHDYRYFPDPDLPALKLSEVPDFQNIELPELPFQKRERYKRTYKIKDEDIESYIGDEALASFFEHTVRHFHTNHGIIQLASNYLTTDILGLIKKRAAVISDTRIGKLDEADFAELVVMVQNGEVSSRGAKEILEAAIFDGGRVRDIFRERGLSQESDEKKLSTTIEKVISENKEAVLSFQSGKEASLKFLIGQAMRESGGSANPQVLEKLFRETLKK